MSGYALRLFGDPVLKQPARNVDEITADLIPLVHGMYETMAIAEGVGLAAPQVGVRKRLFTYDLHEGDGPGVVINPEIVERSEEMKVCAACLAAAMRLGRRSSAAIEPETSSTSMTAA